MQAESGDTLKTLAAELVAAVRASAAPPLLLDPRAAWEYLGLSKSGLYRLASSDTFPRPVEVPGAGPRWRRSDLDRWAEKLKTRRRAKVPN